MSAITYVKKDGEISRGSLPIPCGDATKFLKLLGQFKSPIERFYGEDKV